MTSRERERERERHAPQPTPEAGPAGPDGGNLDALSAEGAAFLAAGAQIVNAALSGNSEAFLAANRQQGGQ
ncbi:MAG TPA: hypothetical protein VNH84_22550 [Candidatus Saccharimonadales bacterium]|jgi:hypothetical protein|nr:hypothetical protein [Candidatus Saccharimonadales bacterium]